MLQSNIIFAVGTRNICQRRVREQTLLGMLCQAAWEAGCTLALFPCQGQTMWAG